MKISNSKVSSELNNSWSAAPKKKMGKKISHFSKFKLLMWKNWLIQRRQKKQTVLEVVLSLAFCILLVIIRDLAPSDIVTSPTVYQPFSISTLPDSLKRSGTDDLTEMFYNVIFSDEMDETNRVKRYVRDGDSKMRKKMYSFASKSIGQNESVFVDNFASVMENIIQRRNEIYSRRRRRRSKRQTLFNVFDNWFGDPAWPIAYTPNNSVVKEIMDHVSDYLNVDTSEEFGFTTEEEMVSHLTTFSLDPDSKESIFFGLEDVLGGIVFTNSFPNESMPDDISYKIRLKGSPRTVKKRIVFEPTPTWATELIYPLFQVPGPRAKDKNEGGKPGYYSEGFLTLQYAIDRSIALQRNDKSIDPWVDVRMQRMPFPEYIDDKYLVALQAWLPLILLLSFLYPSVNIVKSVVYEKEKKLKESMKMMGLNNWLHWTAWFTKSLMMLLITCALITLLLCTRWQGKGSLAVLDSSDPSFVFFFLFIYSCTAISFCFLMSTLFSKANSAATAAGFLWMFSYLPNIFVRPRFLMISTEVKVGLCLYFNLGLSLGCFLASMFEGAGSGLQWKLIASGVSPDSPFSMAHVFVMMCVDIVLYSLLTWYIEAVFPGEFGVPQPYYFPFTKTYWFGPQQLDEESTLSGLQPNQEYFEPEQSNKRPGITVNGLTKKFGKNKTAVNNMYLKVIEGQITVLLGHNGAGKTTTMSMLTGLYPPSAGTAKVNGYDIIREIDAVRTSIGICPQHDILFDELTVAEHIKFFSVLKGMPEEKTTEEIKQLIAAVQLGPKLNETAKTLSGGMKRKLCVAISLCAGSKVVILDEPTTGMDPGARRIIWDLLQRERQARTILLSTHFMEEADLLGDRIAIMANGVIQCFGSPLFLKGIYGAGYHLTFVKRKFCDVRAITDLIQSHVSRARMELNVAAELTYTLPNGNSTKFENLFDEIEHRQDELKISSYGASQTTMEEVFLRVGKESNGVQPPPDVEFEGKIAAGISEAEKSTLLQQDIETIELDPMSDKRRSVVVDTALNHVRATYSYVKRMSSSSSLPVSEPDDRTKAPLQRNSGFRLFFQQLWAMLVKKAVYTFRNIVLSACLILIPVMFLLLAMLILRNIPGVNDTPPSLLATLNTFDGTKTTLASEGNSSISQMFDSSYSSIFNERNNLISINASKEIEDFLLEQAYNDLSAFNLHWMTAVKSVDRSSSEILVTSYFNNRPYHVPPIALNLVTAAILRVASNNSQVTISTSNHPLPRTDTEKLTQDTRSNMGFNIGFNLAFGFSFLSASFLLFLVKERESRCKHLQFVSGVSHFIYWLANAIWDTLFFLVTVFLVLACLYVYNEEGLSEGPQLARLLFILVLYIWAMLPLMYIFSFIFDVPSTGYIRMSLINMFTGMATLTTVAILRIPDLKLSLYANILDWVFMTFPPYAMAAAIAELYTNVRFTKICNRNFIRLACSITAFENPCCRDNCGPFGCVSWTEDLFSWEKLGIGRMLIFLAVEGALGYLLLVLFEMRIFRSIRYFVMSIYTKLRYGISTVSGGNNILEDDIDVRAEKIRINTSPIKELFNNEQLLIKNLRKVYENGVVAVDNLSIGVPQGECFGLLGVNGAGKTSTFKMLTGDLPITSGDAYIGGFSVKRDIKQVQKVIGYCPQFDAVLEQLTGRETMRMFARLRGIPEKMINDWIQNIADRLLLTAHFDKLVGKYSGGNKRKLSTGIALIGDPSILFLDEPSSGMDPVARRNLWDVLNSVRDGGRCIILTSHSMEECEALCTRLAIMTNGKFRCLGSPQYLKSKFSEGYSVTISVKVSQARDWADICLVDLPPEMISIHNFINSQFKESVLRERHWGRLEYFIPVTSATWSRVFGLLEANLKSLNIEAYSVTQTTLERVFLNFTRDQVPEVT